MNDIRPTTVYLVRHGSTEDLEAGRTQGQRRDSGLSPFGRQQVSALPTYLDERTFDVVYCSDLRRARETAEVLASGRAEHVLIDQRLRELDFGDWEGLTLAEIAERWPGEDLRPYTVPHRVAAYGGESIRALRARAGSFLKDIREEYSEEEVMVVAHAQLLSALLCVALELSIGKNWRFGIDPASVSTLKLYPDGTAFLLRLNEVAALY